jgi:L-ascorbate metabolism protein UlaG (beta-lactamase superfamily)
LQEFDHLSTTELPLGRNIEGKYRGDIFHTIPRAHGPTQEGHVFLETESGPVALSGDGGLFLQLKGLKLQEGDRITVWRAADGAYRVIRLVGPPSSTR